MHAATREDLNEYVHKVSMQYKTLDFIRKHKIHLDVKGTKSLSSWALSINSEMRRSIISDMASLLDDRLIRTGSLRTPFFCVQS